MRSCQVQMPADSHPLSFIFRKMFFFFSLLTSASFFCTAAPPVSKAHFLLFFSLCHLKLCDIRSPAITETELKLCVHLNCRNCVAFLIIIRHFFIKKRQWCSGRPGCHLRESQSLLLLIQILSLCSPLSFNDAFVLVKERDFSSQEHNHADSWVFMCLFTPLCLSLCLSFYKPCRIFSFSFFLLIIAGLVVQSP